VTGLAVDLRRAVGHIARVPKLLVACDYDGTLAPLMDDPAAARPLPASVAALRALAALPRTAVAVISGRALWDLAELCGLGDEVHLVGSHGWEFEVGIVEQLSTDLRAARSGLEAELERIADRQPGVWLESKPVSVAVHLRTAAPDVAAGVLDAVRSGPATWPQVHVKNGKQVIELSVVPTHKGAALDRLRGRLGANAVVFLGDDATDEDAFAQLRGPDVGVKIGEGETAAAFRIGSPFDVAQVLTLVLETRRSWLSTGSGAR
jgi:trehalose 6-phosphate phosphatase